jgi:hypothetical protein
MKIKLGLFTSTVSGMHPIKLQRLFHPGIFLLLLISIWPSMALAEDASITDISVRPGAEYLEVDFTVTNCFTEDMKEAIHNGITTTFTFLIDLERMRTLWWDKKVAKFKVSHQIQYDNLKKVYNVKRSEYNHEVVSVKDFKEAERLMSRIEDLKITRIRKLEKGEQYQLHMMAELDMIRLPLYLHYVFFFLSLWDFETDWHTVEFRY